MSRTSVRAQIVSYLQAGTITDLNQVFTTFPKRINFQVNATAGQLNRCAAVVFIASEQESRIALGGENSGWKRVDYGIIIQLFHHSLESDASDSMAAFDTTIDDLKDYLRADHRLGDPTGTIIWQGAEPEISVEYAEPSQSNGGATETWAGIQFTVTEMLQA